MLSFKISDAKVDLSAGSCDSRTDNIPVSVAAAHKSRQLLNVSDQSGSIHSGVGHKEMLLSFRYDIFLQR